MSGQFVFSATLKIEGAKAKAEVDAATQSVKKLGDEAAKAGAKQGVAANDVRKIGAAGAEAANHLNGLAAAERNAAQGAMDLARQGAHAGLGIEGMAVKIGSFAGTAAGAILSVLNPVSLLQGAVYGVSSAMVEWLAETWNSAKSLEDQIKAVTEAVAAWRQESGRSFSDLRKDFGTITPELLEMRRQMQDLRLREILLESAAAMDVLSKEFDSFWNLSSRQGEIADLLGLDLSVVIDGFRQVTPAVEAVSDALDGIAAASGVKEQLSAAQALRESFLAATGGIDQMTAEQLEFYGSVLDAERAMRLVAVATGDVASGAEDAGRSATELANRAQSVVSAMAAADGRNLVAAFQAAFPAASQLLGMAQSIISTIGGLQPRDPGVGMGRGRSPGGPLIGSADLAGLQAGGGVWRVAPVKVPNAPGGGGGGADAAKKEANALQDLVDSLNDEIAMLREHDPVQKEMLKHREVLAKATDAEKKKVEELITTREREKATLEGLREISGMVGDTLIDALMGADDAGKRLIETLIRAGLEAALLGKGPLAGLFGGGDNGGFLGMLLESFFPGVGAGKAGGGMVHGPGDGTKDTFLTPTANGEFIVNARATARNRQLLESINAGGRVRGYADGGYVGGGGMAPANSGQRPVVNIINRSPEPIREAEGGGPDAEGTVTLIVGQAIGKGRLDRQNQARWGLTPKVARR